MKKLDSLHPIVLFTYFMLVVFISMCTVNPVFVTISFLSSLVLYALLTNIRKMFKVLLSFVLLIIFMSLINPIFSRHGATKLFTIGYYDFTLESMLYGFFTSMMLSSVIIWFMSFSIVFKSDKFIYMFGKIIPKISLVLSVTLNFIPRFTRYFREVEDAQKTLGIYEKKLLKMKLRVFSIVFGMGLESSIETSNSMKARGYGISGRSNYSLFKFRKSDTILETVWFLLGAYTLIKVLMMGKFNYYPNIDNIVLDLEYIIPYVSFLILTFSSAILEIKENMLWHYLKLKN